MHLICECVYTKFDIKLFEYFVQFSTSEHIGCNFKYHKINAICLPFAS